MPDSLADKFPLPDIPPTATVLKDTPCRSCGYNLRTLARKAICPECATPVAESMLSHHLRDADPGYLIRLFAGLRISQGTLWLYVVAAFFGLTHTPLVWRVASVVASGVLLLGTWLLTTPDPSGLCESIYGKTRNMARWLGVAQFAGLLALAVSFSASPKLYTLAEYVAFPAVFVWGLFVLLYFRKLGCRVVPGVSSISSPFTMDGNILAYICAFLLIAGVTISTAGWRFDLRLVFWRGWVSLIFVISGMFSFAKALKVEIAASKAPSMWRIAGGFVQSIGK
jgi:hypothetical protein